MKLTKNDRNITIILGEKNEKTNERKEKKQIINADCFGYDISYLFQFYVDS